MENLKLKIASFVFLTFLGYFCIGLPLAVLPMYIHKTLGFSEITAGIVISVQYVSTFLLRGIAGNLVDKKGPKVAVNISMTAFIISGILLFISLRLPSTPMLSLSMMIIARLAAGCGEGMIGASPISWAILTVGSKNTSTAISYNGIASYGALAVGAPLGVILSQTIGYEYIGIGIILVGIMGLFWAKQKTNVIGNSDAPKKSFLGVLGLVAPFGICLGLAGLGFGGLSNFITLYYDFKGWSNAALSLTIFSVLFVLGRLFFSRSIDRLGGLKVGIICLIVETIGLFVLFSASNTGLALVGAAITGLGFSLVFPALGVVAVQAAPPSNAGAALAAYGLFIDISLGVTGPLAGGVIHFWGMGYLFLFCALAVAIGLIIGLYLYSKGKNVIVAPE